MSSIRWHYGDPILLLCVRVLTIDVFEQKYEKISEFVSENFQFWVVKFSIYLNRHVFVMKTCSQDTYPVDFLHILKPILAIGKMEISNLFKNH